MKCFLFVVLWFVAGGEAGAQEGHEDGLAPASRTTIFGLSSEVAAEEQSSEPTSEDAGYGDGAFWEPSPPRVIWPDPNLSFGLALSPRWFHSRLGASFVFSDYMRPSVRLAALNHLQATFVVLLATHFFFKLLG